MSARLARLRSIAVAVFALALSAAPAAAQWTRVTPVPITQVFGLFANADTIVAGVDTATWVSTNAGLTWKVSAKVTAGVAAVDGLWFRNGRLFAGTFGQGVFVSDNLGDTWQAFNQGLVGGFLDSQLDVGTLQVRGDSIYAPTFGAGVYVRGLANGSTWSHFGEVFEPAQASNISDLSLGGNRLLASPLSNGHVFIRDPGDADWTESFVNNVGLSPAVSAQTAAWTGTGWIVGSNAGIFHSTQGQSPWSFVDLGFGGLDESALATRNGRVFGAFTRPTFAAIETSVDDGATWGLLEIQPSVFVFHLALAGGKLYAARGDGLWVRTLDDVSVPPVGPGTAGLRFAVLGAQPVTDAVRLRFELPAPGAAALDVYDVRGRHVGERIAGTYGAGPQEIAWSARQLAPGVYAARLTAAGQSAVVRLVHVR